MDNLVLLGQFLKANRRRCGLSQRALAKRCRISARTVSRIEAGQIPSPREDTLRRLSTCLQIAWSDVVPFLIPQPTYVDSVIDLAARVPADRQWFAIGVLQLLVRGPEGATS